MGLVRRLRVSLEAMSPAYFGMVMATGILSLAAHLLSVPRLPRAFFALNWVLFAIIALLALARACWHTRRVLADLLDHSSAPGFFTFVAACGVLGSQCLIIGGSLHLATLLGSLGLIAWVVLTYTIFTVLTVKEEKPGLDRGINGGWLLAVVATQSMAVLSALIAVQVPQPMRLELNFFALSMWLWGGMLYIWMMSLIFYRYTFFQFSPADLSPPYWINMGAAAISTLAGTMLVAAAPHSPVIEQVLPFVRGLTLLWWATATWWIPMLVILGVWRHILRRFPLRYDPLYWGAVFPLGMYTVCTARISRAVDAPYLLSISRVFVYVALGAWALAAAGMTLSLVRRGRSSS